MKIKEQFLTYVREYDLNDPQIAVKYRHSLMVSALCRDLAERLHLKEADVELAATIGLLHDIGRFEQARRYHTFEDRKSISHALLSCKILFEDGVIRTFTEDRSNDALILHAISTHSDRLPADFGDERTMLFSYLLRDCDKIDILRVHQEHAFTDFLTYDREEMEASAVSEEVAAAFMNHETVDFAYRRTPLDILLSHDAIVFGLHFDAGKAMLKERGYALFTALCGLDFKRQDTRDKLQRIYEECQSCGFLCRKWDEPQHF